MRKTLSTFLAAAKDGVAVWSGSPAHLRKRRFSFLEARAAGRFTTLVFQSARQSTPDTHAYEYLHLCIDRKKGCVAIDQSDRALLGHGGTGVPELRHAARSLPIVLPFVGLLLARNAAHGVRATVAGMDRDTHAFYDAVRGSVPPAYREELKVALRNLRVFARRAAEKIPFEDARKMLSESIRVDSTLVGPYVWFDGDGYTPLDQVASAVIDGRATTVFMRGSTFHGLEAADLLIHHREHRLRRTNGAPPGDEPWRTKSHR